MTPSMIENRQVSRFNFRSLTKASRWSRRAIGRWIIRHANSKRNAAYWREAGQLYRIALIFVPDRHDVAVQAGNCFKEAGLYDLALRHYERAEGSDQRAEAMLQKGDTLARGGAASEAIEALEQAVGLGHPRADARLSEVAQFGLLGSTGLKGSAPRLNQPLAERFLLNRITRGRTKDRRWLGSLDRTTHEKLGGPGVFWRDHIAFTQVGCLKVRNQGRSEPLLTGVVAVRARIVSSAALKNVHLLIEGRLVAEAAPVEVGAHSSGRRLYSVNIWLDAAALPVGRQSLALTATDVVGGKQAIKTIANIVRTPKDFSAAESDAFVASPPQPTIGDAAAEVASRPAEIRSAARRLIEAPVRDILVMRVDQLGDLSASLPALFRLRTMFPSARITALVAPGLVELVQASGCCDEVLSLHLAYDHATERRYLDAGEEARVRETLSERNFDLAIDLCPGDETRPLLKMTDARILVGFNPRNFDFLDFGIDVVTRDKINRIAKAPHAASVLMLIECLEEVQRSERPAVRRLSDDREPLSEFGLTRGGYLLIHTGARHPLNQWPIQNYIALADRFIEATGGSLVFFSDQPIESEMLSSCRHKDRIQFLQKTSMEVFDMLISNAAVMMGNDSGPKHLAAARGVETVSLHVNRLNWNEWGQDSRGLIVTKKVPCCGCGLNDVKMCAKEVLCLTSIGVDDAFSALMDRWNHVTAATLERPTLARKPRRQ
jgi:ADP-heptose:LPS heptosyltransferase